MPAMPRWNKKARKIMEDIMGKQPNAIDVSSKEQKKINKRLISEEGQWAR